MERGDWSVSSYRWGSFRACIKYLGCILDEISTDGAECSRKVASGRRITGEIRPLVNAMDL